MPHAANRYLMVGLDETVLGFPLDMVETVIRAADFAPLPRAAEFLMGVLNVHGIHVPVLNLRRVLRKPDAPVRASQRIVLVRSGGQRAAVYVDEVFGLTTGSGPGTDLAKAIEANLAPGIAGAIDYRGRTALIHDLSGLIEIVQREPGAPPIAAPGALGREGAVHDAIVLTE